MVKLDPHKKRVYLDDGSEISYDKCLLATGMYEGKNIRLWLLCETFARTHAWAQMHRHTHTYTLGSQYPDVFRPVY